jgi:hypothetical protein
VGAVVGRAAAEAGNTNKCITRKKKKKKKKKKKRR